MQKVQKILNKHPWIIIVMLGIPTCLALLVPGYFGASDDMHPAWLYEMHQSITSGQFPVRFVPDLSFGYGYPLFNFVFPLPFYIAEIFYLIGFTLVGSVKAVMALSLVLSGVSMFYLLKRFAPLNLSILGSVVYLYAPFRATEIYVRGAIGEATAFIFLPLILLSVVGVVADRRYFKWIGIGAFSIAGLITSHNISGLMFMPFVLLYMCLYCIFNKFKLASLSKFSAIIILGLLCSVFFWLPAISESALMKYDTVFNYFDHFPTIRQLIIPYFGYGASVPGPGDGMSFFMGLANILFIALSAIVIINWKKIDSLMRTVALWSVISIIVSVFIMNYRSSVLWDKIPLITYFQFPWRFLILTTFLSSVLVISLKPLKPANKVISVLIVLVVLLNIRYFRPADFLGRGDDYFLKRYIPYPTLNEEYLSQNEEYLRLPKNTLTRPTEVAPKILLDNGSFTVNELNALDIRVKVDLVSDATLIYSKYNFPGWTAFVDGKRVDIKSGSPYGQIAVDLPENTKDVLIIFRETKTRMLLNVISLIAITLSTYLVVKKGKAV
jgi:hypothetical protein